MYSVNKALTKRQESNQPLIATRNSTGTGMGEQSKEVEMNHFFFTSLLSIPCRIKLHHCSYGTGSIAHIHAEEDD